jgi:hypothetical protein
MGRSDAKRGRRASKTDFDAVAQASVVECSMSIRVLPASSTSTRVRLRAAGERIFVAQSVSPRIAVSAVVAACSTAASASSSCAIAAKLYAPRLKSTPAPSASRTK